MKCHNLEQIGYCQRMVRKEFGRRVSCILLYCFLSCTSMYCQWSQLGSTINGLSEDYLGVCSISDNGLKVAVGARNGTDTLGKVQVYSFSGGSWNQLGGDIKGDEPLDYFGSIVSLDSAGSVVAVAAPYNSAGGIERGAVRIYNYNGTNWVQKGSDIVGELDYSACGNSIALSADGNIIAVTSPTLTNGIFVNAVKVYNFINNNWVQQGNTIIGIMMATQSVAISNDGAIVAVGTWQYDQGVGNEVCFVKVYSYSNSMWSQIGATLDGEHPVDHFGYCVALNSTGTTLAVGAPRNDGGQGPPNLLIGHVRVYSYINGNWIQQGADIDGEGQGDQSGSSVSISSDGTVVAIGAPNSSVFSPKGQVRVYKFQNGNWSQRGADIDGIATGDDCGADNCVSLSSNGNTVSVGAIDYPFGSGYLRTYQYTPPLANRPLVFLGKKVSDRIAELSWRVLESEDFVRFDLLRSSGNSTWEKIAVIPSTDHEAKPYSYEYLDSSPQSGNNYYQLEQIGVDGGSVLSEIITISFNDYKSVVVHPNPINETLSITCAVPLVLSDIKIVNMLGVPFDLREIDEDSSRGLTIDVRELPTGLYYVLVATQSFLVFKK